MMRKISETCMKVRNFMQLLYVAMRVSKTIGIDPAFLRTVESAKWDMEKKERKKKDPHLTHWKHA